MLVYNPQRLSDEEKNVVIKYSLSHDGFAGLEYDDGSAIIIDNAGGCGFKAGEDCFLGIAEMGRVVIYPTMEDMLAGWPHY